jgi:predicted acetyltransferase
MTVISVFSVKQAGLEILKVSKYASYVQLVSIVSQGLHHVCLAQLEVRSTLQEHVRYVLLESIATMEDIKLANRAHLVPTHLRLASKNARCVLEVREASKEQANASHVQMDTVSITSLLVRNARQGRTY